MSDKIDAPAPEVTPESKPEVKAEPPKPPEAPKQALFDQQLAKIAKERQELLALKEQNKRYQDIINKFDEKSLDALVKAAQTKDEKEALKALGFQVPDAPPVDPLVPVKQELDQIKSQLNQERQEKARLVLNNTLKVKLDKYQYAKNSDDALDRAYSRIEKYVQTNGLPKEDELDSLFDSVLDQTNQEIENEYKAYLAKLQKVGLVPTQQPTVQPTAQAKETLPEGVDENDPIVKAVQAYRASQPKPTYKTLSQAQPPAPKVPKTPEEYRAAALKAILAAKGGSNE